MTIIDNTTLNEASAIFDDLTVGGEFGIGTVVQLPVYPGPYDIIPSVVQQTFKTTNIKMTDDLVVEKIPYFETINESGTTVIIGN